jgi:hypothetical protein
MRRAPGLLLFALACAPLVAAGPDVLIVYDAGAVYKTIAPETGVVVAGASSSAVNCKTVAERLGAELEQRKLTVRLALVSDIHDRRELMEPRLLVLGTPVRFSNVSWEIKKLFDEQFYRIFTTSRAEFARHQVAAFAMGEVEPAARAALDTMRAAVHDCGGTLGETLVLVADTGRVESVRDIRQFAGVLASALH